MKEWLEFIEEIAQQKIESSTYHQTFVEIFGRFMSIKAVSEKLYKSYKTIADSHLPKIYKYFEKDFPELQNADTKGKKEVLIKCLKKLYDPEKYLDNGVNRSLTSANLQNISLFNPNFIGRKKVLTDLDKLFTQHRSILIQGEGGIGKSTVAKFYCRKFEHDLYTLGTIYNSHIATAELLVDQWLQKFFGEEISRQDFSIKLARFRKYLQNDDRNICFVLDNIEPAGINLRRKLLRREDPSL